MLRHWIVVILLAVASSALSAQSPPPGRPPNAKPLPAKASETSLSARDVRSPERIAADLRLFETARDSAMRLTTRGDTAGAVRVLRAATEKAPNSAEVWHEYGQLLYAWTRPYWRAASMPNGIPSRIVAAESSLARAMWLAPDSANYALDYARNLFGSNWTSLRMSQRASNDAMLRATRAEDTARMVSTADQLGVLIWRRFETEVGGRIVSSSTAACVGVDTNVMFASEMAGDCGKRRINRAAIPLSQRLYDDALEYFDWARTTSPDDERSFRHEMMVLGYARQFDRMEVAARERLAKRPSQAWAWLALGVAQQYRGMFRAAEASIDSGFALLDERERDRLLSLTRILHPSQKDWFDTMPAIAKAQLSAMYWSNSDPSLLKAGNPLRTEFRARLAFAEFMWTDDEKRVRGSETDKGIVFIRLGPPAVAAQSFWRYKVPAIALLFKQGWGYGTAWMDPDGKDSTWKPLIDSTPSWWANVADVRRGIDSIDMQVARFRGVPDSVDVLVLSEVPVGSMRQFTKSDTSRLASALFSLDDTGEVLTRRVDSLLVRGHDPLATHSRTQRVRLPQNTRMMRAEALDPETEKVARGIVTFAAPAENGFGMSDLVIAARIVAPEKEGGARWNRYTIEPMRGRQLLRGTPVELLWETYDLQERDAKVSHRVTVALDRIEPKGIVAVTARLLGTLQGAITGRGADGRPSTITYERSDAPGPVVTEQLRIDPQNAPSGDYRITVTITDLATGQTTQGTRYFTYVDPPKVK